MSNKTPNDNNKYITVGLQFDELKIHKTIYNQAVMNNYF